MTIFSIVLTISLILLAIALLIALYRFIIGPSLTDRISSLDLIASYIIALLIVAVMVSDQLIFFDIALVFSLVAFLGSLCFAFYLINRR